MLGHSVPLGTQVRQHENPCLALTTGTERAGVFMLQHPGRLHTSQGAMGAGYSQLLIWLHVRGWGGGTSAASPRKRLRGT